MNRFIFPVVAGLLLSATTFSETAEAQVGEFNIIAIPNGNDFNNYQAYVGNHKSWSGYNVRLAGLHILRETGNQSIVHTNLGFFDSSEFEPPPTNNSTSAALLALPEYYEFIAGNGPYGSAVSISLGENLFSVGGTPTFPLAGEWEAGFTVHVVSSRFPEWITLEYSGKVCAAVFEAPGVAAEDRMVGDVNLDGIVEDEDVTICGVYYGQDIAPSPEMPNWLFCDFDGNGAVDDNDITILGATYGLSCQDSGYYDN